MREEPFWRRYLRFLGPDIEADIDDELNFHLEMRERDFLAAGMAPEQAREAERARSGDVAEVRKWLSEHDRKLQRRRDKVEILDQFIQDGRYGLRKLWQQPGFTAAAVAVLALGIGATTAIFSAVDAVLLRPLPFADAERLVQIGKVDVPMRFGGFPEPPKGQPDITDLAALPEVFASYSAYAPGGLNLTGTREPIRVRIAMVTPRDCTRAGRRLDADALAGEPGLRREPARPDRLRCRSGRSACDRHDRDGATCAPGHTHRPHDEYASRVGVRPETHIAPGRKVFLARAVGLSATRWSQNPHVH